MATYATPSPQALSWMARVRVPLIAVTVALVALDAIGLGLRWADVSSRPISEVTPRVLRPHVTGPEAVVAGGRDSTGIPGSVSSSAADSFGFSGRTANGSGAFIGPVAPPVVRPTPNAPQPGGSPRPAPTPAPAPAPAVPLAQVDVAVPGAAQVSAGAGDNSCTTVDLTLLALGGNCPAPTGDGPVIVHTGGSLLGG